LGGALLGACWCRSAAAAAAMAAPGAGLDYSVTAASHEVVDEEMLAAATLAALEWGQEALCKVNGAEIAADTACMSLCTEEAAELQMPSGGAGDLTLRNAELEAAALVAIQWGQEALSQPAATDSIEALDCEDGGAPSAETTAGAESNATLLEDVIDDAGLDSGKDGLDTGDLGASSADSKSSGPLEECQGSACLESASSAADRTTQRLQGQVDELEACLALQGERQIRECRQAARSRAVALECRFHSEIADAQSLVRRLEDEAVQREQEAKRKDRRIQEAERLLRTTEQRIQQLVRSVPEVADLSSQSREDEAEVERMNSRHQAELDVLQAELRQVREQSSSTTAELQEAFHDAKLKVESLASRTKELARVSDAGEQLRKQLHLSDERAAELEASSELLQRMLEQSSARVDELRQHGAALAQAAATGEGCLRADLSASLARERELESELEELAQADDAAESLQEQLDSSNTLVSGMEAAFISLQTQLEDLQQREAAAAPWRQERDELRSELIESHAAEEAAHDRVAELQSEINSLRAERSSATAPDRKSSESATDEDATQTSAELQTTVALQQAEVERAKASLEDARARLDARERRVQLLAWRLSTASHPEPATRTSAPSAQLQAKLQEVQQRVVDLEDIMADQTSRLERCRKERSELLRQRRYSERADEESSRRESDTWQSHEAANWTYRSYWHKQDAVSWAYR